MIADRLNPLVLKELRQGLKSKSFVASFLALQVLMVVSMFIYFAAGSTFSGDMTFANGFFWFMLGIILLLFMPLRSFGALYGELKGNTLEMLFLTRLSSWDIAFGKWLALLMQIGLLVCAVLPYLVLRYYLGSVDVTADLVQLGLQVLVSSLLVAAGVGLSAWTNKLLRGLVIFWALTSLYSLPLFLLGAAGSGMAAFAFLNWVDVLVWISVSVLVMLYFVEFGASQIAPHAENHSIRKRALAAGVSLLLLPYAVLVEKSIVPLAVSLGALTPVAIDLLSEPVYWIRSLYRCSGRVGPFRWLIYPGWPGSLLCILLLGGLHLAAGAVVTGNRSFTIWVLALFNILLYPFFFIRLIPFLARKAIISYLLLQAGFTLLFVVSTILFETLPGTIELVSTVYFPPTGFYMLMDEGPEVLNLGLLLLPTGVMVLVHVIKAVPLWRAMARLGKESS